MSSPNVSQKLPQKTPIIKNDEMQTSNDFPEIRRSLRIICDYYGCIYHVRDQINQTKRNIPSP